MPLDDADKKFIADLIGTKLTDLTGELDKKYATSDAVQKIVTQGLEGLDVPGKIKAGLDEGLKDVREKLKGKGGDGDGDGGDGGGKSKGKGGESDPELARLKEQMAEMERKNREAEEARQAAETREKQNRLNAAVNDALGAAGIPADRHAQARAYLHTLTTDKGEPILAFDDNGRAVYRIQKTGYVDALDIKAGIKAWAETDAGKLYLPPTGNQGTGEGGGSAPPAQRGNAPRTQDGSVDWGKLRGNLNTGSVLAGATS